MTDSEKKAWDDAVDAAWRKVLAIQTGFRGQLKTERAKGSASWSTHSIEKAEDLIAVLGDCIRNIGALKGNYP